MVVHCSRFPLGVLQAALMILLNVGFLEALILCPSSHSRWVSESPTSLWSASANFLLPPQDLAACNSHAGCFEVDWCHCGNYSSWWLLEAPHCPKAHCALNGDYSRIIRCVSIGNALFCLIPTSFEVGAIKIPVNKWMAKKNHPELFFSVT